MQFIRSGRVALTRDPIERLSEFLKERMHCSTGLCFMEQKFESPERTNKK
jgi:hypothetical protein